MKVIHAIDRQGAQSMDALFVGPSDEPLRALDHAVLASPLAPYFAHQLMIVAKHP